MISGFTERQEFLAGCGEEPPPAFSHPLGEGDLPPAPLSEGGKRQEAGTQLCTCTTDTAPSKPIPLLEGVPEGRGRFTGTGVPEGRGRFTGTGVPANRGRSPGTKSRRLPGEAPEPLPLHRKLYNPYLQPTANTLRKRMTKAEVYLWKYVLRAGQMKGYTFNRQRPVLRYIADFMCKPLKLIIEVDGSVHDDPGVQKHDAFRQAELEACGFTVMRITNDDVLQNTTTVRDSILLKVNELESGTSLNQANQGSDNLEEQK